MKDIFTRSVAAGFIREEELCSLFFSSNGLISRLFEEKEI